MKIRLRHNALMNEYEKFFNGETENVYSEDAEDFTEEMEEAENVAEYVDIDELSKPDEEVQTKENKTEVQTEEATDQKTLEVDYTETETEVF